jgi:hypothetical protein
VIYHARLADHGKYLTMSGGRLLYDLLKGFNLGLPSYKRGESAGNGSMETCSGRGSTHEFVRINGSRNSFHFYNIERFDFDESFDLAKSSGCHQDRAAIRKLLHPGG